MSFNICIVKNPVYVLDTSRECEVISWNENEGDHHLDLDFDGKDFDELQKFLGINLSSTERFEGESDHNHEQRLKNNYLEAAKEKGYEMLGRIWYWYESVVYLSSEINQLLAECLRLKDETQNLHQAAAMDKLLTACREASATNSGIVLASD